MEKNSKKGKEACSFIREFRVRIVIKGSTETFCLFDFISIRDHSPLGFTVLLFF